MREGSRERHQPEVLAERPHLLEEKLAGQKQIKTLEATRNQKRRSLFDAQDQIDRQRSELIAQIESKLEQKVEVAPLFSIRWRLE